jgi:hypothetical protein
LEICNMRKLIVASTVSVLALGALVSGCGGDSGASSVEVKISVPGATASIHSATIVVDYARSGARPQLSGGKPACTSILPHVSCSFSDDGSGKLTIEASAPQGFSTPVDLAVCRMIPGSTGVDGAAISGKIQVSLANARGSTGQVIEEQATKVANGGSRREAGSPGETVGAGGGAAVEGEADGGTGAVAQGGSGSVPGATGGQGMVVTREDLAARDRKRATDEQRARAAERPIIAPSQGGTAMAPGAAGDSGAGDQGSESEDSEENDPEEFAADATKYAIRFDLTQTAGPVGALQIEIDYTGGSGAWLGAKGGVDCRWMVAAALHACNDKGRSRLTCAVVDQTGFTGPTALMECTFKSKNAVSAGDFRVDVVDSSGVDLAPIEARVVVAGVYAR